MKNINKILNHYKLAIKVILSTLIIFISFFAYAITESEKIEYLLNEIEKSNYIFIRNGSEYGSKAARKHLEYKLSRSPVEINTAENFIKYIASKSSFTGTLYYIKLLNGDIMRCDEWLKIKLKEFEVKNNDSLKK